MQTENTDNVTLKEKRKHYKFTIMCGKNLVHAIKPSTIKRQDGRIVGLTFCGLETSDSIDMWCRDTVGISFCGPCHRAYRKSNGDQPKKYESKFTQVEKWEEK